MSHELESEPESVVRPLADTERAVLANLLTEDFPGRDVLQEQLAEARGRLIDADGSLALVPSPSARAADVVRRIPVEAETEDLDGVTIHVLLHVVDGYVNELEVYREDSARIQRPIRPETLRVLVL
jgi:hypothetical protein